MSSIASHNKQVVSYYYHSDIGKFHFGKDHPMKTIRIVIAHDLIVNYGLYKKMKVYRPNKAEFEDICAFHSEDYATFLKSIDVGTRSNEMNHIMKKFNMHPKQKDCPIFEGMYDFSQISAGGSLAAALNINRGDCDIAINWSGGLHHAKKSEASGFCYVNDIVLCILELLKCNKRVLYVDIDIHHGDGVEEAFLTTDRVMTVSFHRYGDGFFPGTGSVKDIGSGPGKTYAVNVPLSAGITDENYSRVFIPIMATVMSSYDPSVVILQCGSDCLTGDRLGDFNLTLNAHAKCISFLQRYNVPLILLGGGGYTVKNVSRCWTNDTATALKIEIPNDLPYTEYFSYFENDKKLHIPPSSDVEDKNTTKSLTKTVSTVLENIKDISFVPSVQFRRAEHPFPFGHFGGINSEDEIFDVRETQAQRDARIDADNEYYDDDCDNDY